jgi:hypothetical protein
MAPHPLAPVIPLKPYRKNRLVPPIEPRLLEPACLYALALTLHAPMTDGSISGQCAEDWPCEQVRLAYRLREGF